MGFSYKHVEFTVYKEKVKHRQNYYVTYISFTCIQT